MTALAPDIIEANAFVLDADRFREGNKIMNDARSRMLTLQSECRSQAGMDCFGELARLIPDACDDSSLTSYVGKVGP